MALKDRTYIASLAEQRRIARAAEAKTSSVRSHFAQKKSHKTADKDEHTLKDQEYYDNLSSQWIKKLRTLIPTGSSQGSTCLDTGNQEYSLLQDELYRVAHSIRDRTRPHLDPSTPKKLDLEEYKPSAFQLDHFEGRRLIRINLLSRSGFSAASQEQAGPQKTQLQSFCKLDNALSDLSSYRKYLEKSQVREIVPEDNISPKENTGPNFPEESAKITQQILALDAPSEDDKQMKNIALSLLGH